MAEQVAQLLEQRFRIPQEQAVIVLRRTAIGLAALVFVLAAALFVAFDSIFVRFSSISSVDIGEIAPRDIVAPPNASRYVSQILTERARESARGAVQPVFDPPDPNVARQQTQLAQQILDYIENVRADIYGTRDQRTADLQAISALSFDDESPQTILQLDEETWGAIEDEILNVLSRMMRLEIRLGQEQNIRIQLDNQVNARFNLRERRVVVDLIDDLILPNTFENIEATNIARETAAASVEEQTRTFTPGQIIVREGEPIDDLVYEALVALNVLQTDESRAPEVIRALVASTITMVIIGLYMARFAPHLLYNESRRLTLVAAIFLLMLAGTRFLGVNGDIYLFPTGALALTYVAIAGPHMAIIGSLGLALLTGIMANDSLQIATLIAAGGIIGTLALRRADRLNSFFVAGAMIGGINAAVVGIFNFAAPTVTAGQVTFATELLKGSLSGLLLVPATAIAAMYILTILFNLPTVLKLIDLSQPNKPLLQRLLREAPGTYQHSLQVANLSEQAANAIGADAQLTHVAALYHDIGKMLNPLYFTENQQDIGNPHDTLNDPYRSADIIIGHVTEGDELARQYRLPQRIRDFIREHHGTTEVYVFYQRALNQVDGDKSAVDILDFSYPGPRPRSKETGILMMADSCEAAVRSVKPQSKQEIRDLVTTLIDQKRASGQLDDSDLTLSDLRLIREIFVDILQGMFHPRINYKEAVAKKPDMPKPKPQPAPVASAPINGTTAAKSAAAKKDDTPAKPVTPPKTSAVTAEPKVIPAASKPAESELAVAEEEPIPEVPRLPTIDKRRTTGQVDKVLSDNGKPESETAISEDKKDTP